MTPQEEPAINDSHIDTSDTILIEQMQRLHRLTVYGRWVFVVCLWIIIAPVCLWDLYPEFLLWQQYFTWAAVRYSLAFHSPSTVGLALCIGMTTSVLVWQSRNILIGLSKSEQQKLKTQVFKIRQQGSSHPLWKLIVANK